MQKFYLETNKLGPLYIKVTICIIYFVLKKNVSNKNKKD